jgi:hypothetical protein
MLKWFTLVVSEILNKNSLYGLSPHFDLNFYDQTSYTKLKIKYCMYHKKMKSKFKNYDLNQNYV